MELKLTIQEFGEVSNQIMDAFERGEKEIPTDRGIVRKTIFTATKIKEKKCVFKLIKWI